MRIRQIELFGSSPPYQAHSETSREAAESIEPTAGTLRFRVLAYLRDQRVMGATDEEMQEALQMNPSTQRPRRVELWRAGLIYPSSFVRLTRAKRKAAVWFAAPHD